MKLEKLDHKHALTSWLKVILFACLMLAPIMSIVVRSLYVVCNKNAKDSYYGETINEKIETQIQYDELQNNETYLFSNPITANNNVSDIGYMYVSDVKNINGFDNNVDLSEVEKIRFYKTNNYNTLQFYDINETTQYSFVQLSSNSIQFSFVFKGFNLNYTGFQYANYFYQVSYNKFSYLDNVFDYSISQIEESQFYNWTQNTAIYTGVTAMTSGLGITGATIPILITYWFLLTIIYIVIDIVLNLFTYITHYLNKKVE